MRAVCAAVALTLVMATVAPGAPGPKIKPLKVKVYGRGEAFCPAAALVYGSVVIQGGRCYTLFVLRERAGTFLAFGPPGPPMIPPGQIVRLSTPAGAKARGRFFYLVPIYASAVLVPVNTVTLVSVRAEDFGPQWHVTLIGVPSPNVVVIFNARL
jgi:hypothetical protein